MKIFHDSHSAEYRTPFGAAETGSVVTLSLDVTDCDPQRVMLGIWQDEPGSDRWEQMEKTGDGRYSVSVRMPDEGTLLWYAFAAEISEDADDEGDDDKTVYYGNNAERLGGIGSIYSEYPVPYQITVYKGSEVPRWYRDGIIYQIFPGRFARDENWEQRCIESAGALAERRCDIRRIIEYDWDREAYYVKNEKGEVVEWPLYGGSLRGIEAKLDYLKSLGVTGIYLNPLVESASNHHYDTYDYMTVDPSLGTNEDFEHLAAAAKSRGIRIILDGVFSHTGRDSIYFGKYNADGSGAYRDPDSPYRSWYKFDENEACGYKSWWGVEDLPEVNEEDPGFRELINGSRGVIAKWMEMGASGWRLDVADELPDTFIREVRERVKACDPDGLLIGEVWEDASNKISYDERRRYFMGDELDGTMNYPLRSMLLDYINYSTGSGRAGRELMSLRENYPEENFYAALNLIGSHDRERIITAMAAAEDRPSAVKKVRLLSTLQYTLPGVPCIYYGDEAGLAGGADPANRSGFPWGHEDPKLEYHYRMLGLIYKEHPLLASGDLVMLSGRYGISDDIFAFIRSDSKNNAKEKLLVLANRSYGPADVDLSEVKEAAGAFALDLLATEEIRMDDGLFREPIRMEPLSARIICIRDKAPDGYIKERSAGVICHITSLGKPVLGKPARDFVDYLASAGMKIWQVLPLNPAGAGNSPYSSSAAFAGESAFINYDELPDESGFEAFKKENAYWLEGYVAYTIIKEIHDDKAWFEWPQEYRDADPHKAYVRLLSLYYDRARKLELQQYYFCAQWNELREYANSRGVKLMGDLPVYMAADSADVWANRDIYLLDEDGRQRAHAGVPPDGFSADGQDWGNPLYDWDRLRERGYDWWIKRIQQCAERFDILRLDHFRAMSEYFAIPEGGSPADGFWQHGPGLGFFEAIQSALDAGGHHMEILAEDLGHLDDGVLSLLRLTGLCGMDVWQFSASEMEEMPAQKAERRAFYTGTHDNDTLYGFLSKQYHDQDRGRMSLQALTDIEKIYRSPAVLAMLQLQDMFLLGDDARMNVPGVAEGNWTWHMPAESVEDSWPDAAERAAWFRALAERTGRL